MKIGQYLSFCTQKTLKVLDEYNVFKYTLQCIIF